MPSHHAPFGSNPQRGREILGGKRCVVSASIVAATGLAMLTSPGAAGCAEDATPVSPTAATGERADAFATSGIERVVPIRVIHLATAAHPGPYATLAQADVVIDRANRVFRTAGVQFYLKSSEAYIVNDLAMAGKLVDDTVRHCWDAERCPTRATDCASGAPLPGDAVWKDVTSGMFPGLTRDTGAAEWGSCASFGGWNWLDLLNAKFPTIGEIPIFTSDKVSFGGTQFPRNGRMIMIPSSYFGTYVSVAHELGHYFGLAETNVVYGSWNATTASGGSMSDFWDLVYFPGVSAANPHKFFKTRAAAAAYEGTVNSLGQGLAPIDRTHGPDCPANVSPVPGGGSGKISCTIRYSATSYAEVHQHESVALQGGMAFSSGTPDNPPNTYRWGSNIMGYSDIHRDVASSMSESQALIVRSNLRYETQMSGVYTGYSNLPSGRVSLGDAGGSQSQFKLDVDGDQKRDVAIWTPPDFAGGTGNLKVLLSSKSWSQNTGQFMAFAVGALGDTPFITDLNGDGYDDLVFYSPGGAGGSGAASDPSVWKYCLTNSSNVLATTCPQATAPITLGNRGSVPLGAHVMNSWPAVLLVWDASTGLWTSRGINGAAATYAMAPPTSTYRGWVPLPGLYDSDAGTDLVLFDPSTATYRALLSGSGWATPYQRDIPFSASFIPQRDASVAAVRSGGGTRS